MSVSRKAKVNLLSVLVWTSSVVRSSQLTCQDNFRRPDHTDISVECGTSSISLAILICPVIYTGYNESLLILNQIFNMPECTGTIDESSTPPVVRFIIPLNITKACGSTFLTTTAAGTGIFAGFSNVQMVNVSGVVRSHDPTSGIVTYNAELKYYYSCAYPLEYLINNTQVDTSTSSVAVRDNNGTFFSTLSMALFSDANYTTPLVIPPLGLELKTKVHVQVHASNLTNQYLVFMYRCYASISPFPANSTFINLFVLCSKHQMTTIQKNGAGHHGRFSFPAFRFFEQKKHMVSVYYLHCFIRLCEISTCKLFKCNKRKKRDVPPAAGSEDTTLLMLPIATRNENSVSSSYSESRTSLWLALGILLWWPSLGF